MYVCLETYTQNDENTGPSILKTEAEKANRTLKTIKREAYLQ